MNAHAEHARIFGPRDASAELKPGRNRKCRSCGGWHSLAEPWPHNCRPPAPPRNPRLKVPQRPTKFSEFVAGDGSIINDRREMADFCERHELAPYEEGVKLDRAPTEREWEADFVSDLKRAIEEDPLARKPVDVIGRTDLDGTAEIDTADIEVFKE